MNKLLTLALVSNDHYRLNEIYGVQVDIDLGQTAGIPMMDDSMEPSIPPRKAIVNYFPIKNEPENGSMLVIKKDDKIYIRRYYIENRQVILVPDNKDYNPMFIDKNTIILGETKSYTALIPG